MIQLFIVGIVQRTTGYWESQSIRKFPPIKTTGLPAYSDTHGVCQMCHYKRVVTVSSHFHSKVDTFKCENTVTSSVAQSMSYRPTVDRDIFWATGLLCIPMWNVTVTSVTASGEPCSDFPVQQHSEMGECVPVHAWSVRGGREGRRDGGWHSRLIRLKVINSTGIK